MNLNQVSQTPDALRQVLRQWRVEPALPPRFSEGVWRRIEREAASAQAPWAVMGRWMAGWLSRPAWATGFVGVFLAIGLAAGYFQAKDHLKATSARERSLYLQSVNPYFAAAPAPPVP
jgi:hypothetical protein